MCLRTSLTLVLALGLMAQEVPKPRLATPRLDDQIQIPDTKAQRDEILKADYEKTLVDSRELAKLADELKTDLERSDRFSVSLNTVKKTEEIEKLAKRIRGRVKRF